MATQRRTPRLGRVQRMVLLMLTNRGASSCDDTCAWYPLRESQVRGAINRLGFWSLVDVAGFDGRRRTYHVTAKGREVADAIANEGED